MTTKTDKTKKKDVNKDNKSGAEKPVSLWGASFSKVLEALLNTKPKEKKQDKKPS